MSAVFYQSLSSVFIEAGFVAGPGACGFPPCPEKLLTLPLEYWDYGAGGGGVLH